MELATVQTSLLMINNKDKSRVKRMQREREMKLKLRQLETQMCVSELMLL